MAYSIKLASGDASVILSVTHLCGHVSVNPVANSTLAAAIGPDREKEVCWACFQESRIQSNDPRFADKSSSRLIITSAATMTAFGLAQEKLQPGEKVLSDYDIMQLPVIASLIAVKLFPGNQPMKHKRFFHDMNFMEVLGVLESIVAANKLRPCIPGNLVLENYCVRGQVSHRIENLRMIGNTLCGDVRILDTSVLQSPIGKLFLNEFGEDLFHYELMLNSDPSKGVIDAGLNSINAHVDSLAEVYRAVGGRDIWGRRYQKIGHYSIRPGVDGKSVIAAVTHICGHTADYFYANNQTAKLEVPGVTQEVCPVCRTVELQQEAQKV